MVPQNGNGKADYQRVLAENQELRESIRRVERRIPKAGERGQVRSAYSLALQRLGIPNPDKLRASDYEKMLEDPQVLAGSTIIKLAVLAKEGRFNYHPNDKDDEEEKLLGETIVQFLEWQKSILRANPGDWVQFLENVLSAIDYGFSVTELVWASQRNPLNGELELVTAPQPEFEGLHYFERAKLLPASSIESNGFAADAYGNLTAVYQNLTRAIQDAPSLHAVPQVGYADAMPHRLSFTDQADLDRLVIFTPMPGAGNYYGKSELKAAYEHWYAKRWNHSARNVLLERNSGVAILTPGNANQSEALETAGENMSVGGVVVLPEGAAASLLQGWEQAVQGFHEALRYDDIMILRALLVPNETVGGADQAQGSWARANSHLDSFLMGIKHRRTKLEEVVETQVVQRLIEANWGEIPGSVTFDFDELEEEDREKLARIYTAAAGMGVADPRIDAAEIRRELGLSPAPAEHQFTTPQAPATPQPGSGYGWPPAPTVPKVPGTLATVERTRAEDMARVAFELIDTPAQNSVTVEYLEAAARANLAEALHQLQEAILADLPKDSSPAELERLTITPESIRAALDRLATQILTRVRTDMARRFRDLNQTRVADKLTPTTTPTDGMAQVKAFSPSDPLFLLNSYLAWVTARNQEEASRLALDLQHRLRRRVVQDYARGFTLQEIGRGLASEFSSYTQSQLDNVARTTVMDYYNSARNASYEAAGNYVRGIKFVPLLDASTTPFCRSIVGRSISKTDPLYERLSHPPYWHNCRTTIIPITTDDAAHTFDTDWPEWLEAHRSVDGGGFLYA